MKYIPFHIGQRKIKVCAILINGGLSSLKTIKKLLGLNENDTYSINGAESNSEETKRKSELLTNSTKGSVPILIVNHSGRVADLLAMAYYKYHKKCESLSDQSVLSLRDPAGIPEIFGQKLWKTSIFHRDIIKNYFQSFLKILNIYIFWSKRKNVLHACLNLPCLIENIEMKCYLVFSNKCQSIF